MTDEDVIAQILEKAEKYRFHQDLLNLVERLVKMNPKMDKLDAIKIAYEHFKTQSNLGRRN